MPELEVVIDLKENKLRLGSREIELKKPRNIDIFQLSDSSIERTCVHIKYIPDKDDKGGVKLKEYINELRNGLKVLFDGVPISWSSGFAGYEQNISFQLPPEYYNLKIKRVSN